MPTASPFEVRKQAADPAAQRQRTGSQRYPRVLLIRRRYLGDVVLLGSVIRNLRRHWPEAEIAVLTSIGYDAVLPLNPDVDRAVCFPRPGDALAWPGFIQRLRRSQFTHVLDFDNTEKTALTSRLSGAEVRATFDRELIPFRWRWCYTHHADVSNAFYDSHHITETYLTLPAAIGVPIVSREVRLVPPPEAIERAQRVLPGDGNKVLVHPGSRSAYRLWPAERFAAICDQLQSKLGAQVLLTAGAGERVLLERIQSHAQSPLAIAPPPTDVGSFAALAAQCDALLCHDSGPMHIAAAVGTPVIALFGSQNATIWRPLGPRHTVLQTPLPCACIGEAAPNPCVRGDSYRSYCVRKIVGEEVFAAITRTLAIGKS